MDHIIFGQMITFIEDHKNSVSKDEAALLQKVRDHCQSTLNAIVIPRSTVDKELSELNSTFCETRQCLRGGFTPEGDPCEIQVVYTVDEDSFITEEHLGT
jgi:hypothetical protein